jgi:two-component system, OmpR family, phosphate regulon response regulator PhoB
VNTPQTQPRILIIEDEQGLIQSLTWYFEHNGYEVVVARDGVEGLQKARASLPDVILLDLMLPRIHGWDVCRELRAGEHTANIPIIVMSARFDEMREMVGSAARIDDYVAKPFSNKALLAKVKALVASPQPSA